MSVRIRSVRVREHVAALAAVSVLVAVLTGCSGDTTSQGPADGAPKAAASANASTAADEVPEKDATAIGSEKVRDAFAGLQATLEEDCTPGNCAYLLGRVNEELARMDKAMRAAPQGPAHYKEPLAWMGTMRAAVDGDTGTTGLDKHRTELLDTRDRVNTWMQDHPEDYR
ncbi:hypothetical protein [Streptomyces brevispora]|uniref:Lipoprotein n=1 Tax=Streptomyces brevispora TaxID=887462 RepID=A0A561UVJ9_9ACTN|nr:hypothetical protein [Streptomyces brevispora]TWG03381.1 hypothetical protein FHX80_111805 [Streptomyces brevispora]WSC15578.1 hypothetical protein OIE64_23910 [Streptomyces brevispora]